MTYRTPPHLERGGEYVTTATAAVEVHGFSTSRERECAGLPFDFPVYCNLNLPSEPKYSRDLPLS